ncbi:MAG: hypothetical protein WAL81_07945 [Methanobacterium sp.]
MKTLETKNLELKYANRNLISTVSEQKNILKDLQSEINKLKSSKVKEHSFEKLNSEYKKLMEDYKMLQIRYNKSQKEISDLKELIPESKSEDGLFGRFLKRKTSEEDEKGRNDSDGSSDELKK